ncbi:MAG: hypothetical protein PUD51_03175 [Prevotellaceae bacterium]|nr:hypothetical protein [Prevotellaceae bacterium]
MKQYVKPQMAAMEFNIRHILLTISNLDEGTDYNIVGDDNGYYFGD